MRTLVGIAVHQISAAGSPVAPGSANFLVVALERCRQPCVDYCPYVGLVDAHAKCDGGHNYIQFAGLEGGLYTLAHFRIEPRVVGRRVNPSRTAKTRGAA